MTKTKDKVIKEKIVSTPLDELDINDIDKILEKLSLTSPASWEEEGRLELLRCSDIFSRHFERYADEDILAQFKKGKFVDFITDDGKIQGIFPKIDNVQQYPCSVCSKEVSDKLNESGYGIECSGCGLYFHNNCTGTPLSVTLFKALKDSPSYVKILCPPCNSVYGGVTKRVKQLEFKMDCMKHSLERLNKDVSGKIDSCIEKTKSYSQVAAKLTPRDTSIPKPIMKTLNRMTKDSIETDRNEKLRRTRVVVRPKNTDITTSREIRREFFKDHTGQIIKHCRLTAGGSIMFEFEDEQTAVAVENNWKKTCFGGNQGMKKPGQENTAGLIKQVSDDISEKEITSQITAAFPGTEMDFFKDRAGKFTGGTVKLTFKERKGLLEALNAKIKIGNQVYRLEEYHRKSRVIKCHRCQKFGHIQRYCHAKDPKCGKCSSTEHEQKDCTITVNFKCAHCDGDHVTGSNTCKVFKERLEKLISDQYD